MIYLVQYSAKKVNRMQPAWIIVMGIVIVILAVISWILHSSKKRIKPAANETLSPPFTANTSESHNGSKPTAKPHNVVELAAFRERRSHTRRKTDTNSKPAELSGRPAVVRPLPLSKNGLPPSKLRMQKCSYCKKEVNHLTFYANDDGSLVGVCKDCEPIAKRRDLLPL